MDTAILEWKGKEYELKYKFSIIRRLRQEGINVPNIFAQIQKDPEIANSYADEFCAIAAFLLRDAGADAKEEDVWNACKSNQDMMIEVCKLFNWVVLQHYAQSENVPASAKKKEPAKKARTSK